MNISELQPQGIWKAFHALTQVPRPSGHLEKIQAFLLQWAKGHGFESFKDNAGNIIVRVPATEGMEDRPMVTLEGHMDMVPQKSPDSNHDFLTDPIETYIDGDWVKARGTTLGSDDGMGVATAMAIFEDKSLRHGPLEAIFTVDEETCMYGVNNLKADTLKGDILLNLDSESEGELYIGCAGGVDITSTMQYQEVSPSAGFIAKKIVLKGLRGGHSGMEINEGRANAIKQLARVVHDLLMEFDCELASFGGGNMRNAIPFKAACVLTLPKENLQQLKDDVADKAAEGKTVVLDKDLDLEGVASWTPIGSPEHPFCGSFDGNKHSIGNLALSVSEQQASFVGLFGYVGPGGSIKDLTLENCTVEATASTCVMRNIGSLAGYVYGDVSAGAFAIEGCETDAKVSVVSTMGIDGDKFEHAITAAKEAKGVQQDTELEAADLEALVDTFKGIFSDACEALTDVEDLEVASIDENTLGDIVFAYGGDEEVEKGCVLILNKKDLQRMCQKASQRLL